MTINEELFKEELEREQARRRAKAQEQREKASQRKKNTRRNIFIGELVYEIFPEVERFQLQRTRDANEIEFAPLVRMLNLLAADTEYLSQIKDKATIELPYDTGDR